MTYKQTSGSVVSETILFGVQHDAAGRSTCWSRAKLSAEQTEAGRSGRWLCQTKRRLFQFGFVSLLVSTQQRYTR